MRANTMFLRAIALLVMAAVMLIMLPAAWGAVKNERAEPAYAEEQTMLQLEADSRVPEPGLLSTDSGRVHMDRHFLGQYGTKEGNVIVQRGGNTWRHLRNSTLATIAGFLLLVVPFAIFAFYKTIGPADPVPVSGRKLQRFTRWDRQVHWGTAFAFVLLAITGIAIMFGKVIFLPWMGHNLFSWVAIIAKYLHNFAGPLFVVCSIVMFFTFLKRNFFNRVDWNWVKKGGGLITKQHVPAGYFNAGEKAWFWFGVAALGLVVSVTGLVLDFAVGQTRYVMQVANVLHVVGATLYMVFSMGHAYIGTYGTPGAYEAMRHGTVDENWAKAHHELWYIETKTGVPATIDKEGHVVRDDTPSHHVPPTGHGQPGPAL
jgi:formate dehydrogenase subunit gamma